jgi:hypothetical protein
LLGRLGRETKTRAGTRAAVREQPVRLAAPRPYREDARVLVFLLLGAAPLLLWLTLAIALYLTAIELRGMQVHFLWWFFWLLLVVMTHFVGYLFLRAYGVYRRWNTSPG